MDAMKADTDQFYGTEGYHFNPLYKSMNYTDGIQFIGAHGFGWLIDEIGINHHARMVEDGAGFYIVVLDVKDTRAKLTICVDIDGANLQDVLVEKEIDHTDAPEGRLTLYWQNGVLFLPSEY